jgi:hypothetical protein
MSYEAQNTGTSNLFQKEVREKHRKWIRRPRIPYSNSWHLIPIPLHPGIGSGGDGVPRKMGRIRSGIDGKFSRSVRLYFWLEEHWGSS